MLTNNSKKMLQELSNYTRSLESITPAELQFLCNPNKSSTSTLVKISLIDLYLKRIIDFNYKKKLVNEKPYAYHTLNVLKTNNSENLKPHENRILKIVNSKNKDITLLEFRRTLIPNFSYHKIFYFNYIYLNLVKQGFFKRTYIFERMGFYKKTKKGKSLAKFMKKFIPYCEENIDEWIISKPHLLIDLLNKLDTLVLVSDNQYLFWKAIDYFVSLPNKENNRYINILANNYTGKYIRNYCSGKTSVVDYRDIEWERSGFTSEITNNVQDIYYAADQYL